MIQCLHNKQRKRGVIEMNKFNIGDKVKTSNGNIGTIIDVDNFVNPITTYTVSINGLLMQFYGAMLTKVEENNV